MLYLVEVEIKYEKVGSFYKIEVENSIDAFSFLIFCLVGCLQLLN